MRILGLTGGIASGKSTAAAILQQHGGALIDADAVARQVVEPGTPALAAIVSAFGPAILAPSGELDRRALGERIFSDDAARLKLNAIVHPAVIAEMERQLAELQARPTPPPFVVLVVPLLFEAGMEKMPQSIWVLNVDEETQRQRLMSRDALTAAEAEARMASQWPLARKIALADRVIDNRGSRTELARDIERALKEEGLS